MFSPYRRFVSNDFRRIYTIENTLDVLAQVLPGRFAESELVSEFCNCILRLLELYHDGLLLNAAKHNRLYGKDGKSYRVEPSEVTEFYEFFADRKGTYAVIASILTSTQISELMVEMLVERRYGVDTKWKVISAVESVKAACRLALFALSGSRIVPHTVSPTRIIQPIKIGVPNSTPYTPEFCNFHMNRLGFNLDSEHENSTVGITSYFNQTDLTELLNSKKVLGSTGTLAKTKTFNPRSSLPLFFNPLQGFGKLGEILYILRPLAYISMVKRSTKESWYPWLTSLCIEFTSQRLIKLDGSLSKNRMLTNAHLVPKFKHSNRSFYKKSLENEELIRRANLYYYYLVRSPFFDKYLLTSLETFARWASDKPLFSLFGSLLDDYIPLWRQYYYYTSSS